MTLLEPFPEMVLEHLIFEEFTEISQTKVSLRSGNHFDKAQSAQGYPYFRISAGAFEAGWREGCP